MLKSLGAILIYLAIAFFHIRQLKKNKLIREIWVFSILMLFITGITIAMVNNITLPNPLDLISIVIDPLNSVIPS